MRGRSIYPFLGRKAKNSLLDLVIASGVLYACAASCMSGPLTTSRAIVQVSVGICPIASPHAIRPSAPSSLQPSTASACLSWQCRYEGSRLRGYLRDVLSQRLFVSWQGSKHSLVDLAIASGVPCTCAVRSGFLSARYAATHLRVARCVPGLLTASRAIVPVSGRIRPKTASAYAIRASESALRVGAAPVWIALQCRYRESVSRQEGSHVFLFQELLLAAGVDLLRSLHRVQAAKRDVVIQSWIRPPISSAHAIRVSAPSSFRPSTDPVCHSAQRQSLLHACFRSELWCHLFLPALKQMCFLHCGCAVRSSFVVAGPSTKHVRDASCKSGPLTTSRAIVPVRTWGSPGMTKPSVLVGMLQPASPVPSPRAVYLRAAPARRLAKCLPAAPGSSSRREEHAMVLAVAGLQIQQMFDRVPFRHCQCSQPLPVSGFSFSRSRNCFDMCWIGSLDHQLPKKASSH